MYYRFEGSSKWLILCLYVDNLLIRGDAESLRMVIAHLKSKYNVLAEGDIKRYLRINMTTGRGPWKLDQSREIEEFLHEYGMDTAKPVDRPGDTALKYDKAIEGPKVNQPQYQSIIGGLLWFTIATQPDILYAVNIIVHFQQALTTCAWTVVKRIMKYLKGSMNIGITIDLKNDEIDIYSDANHGDISLDDQKSISRGTSFAIARGNVFVIGSMSSKSAGECYG